MRAMVCRVAIGLLLVHAALGCGRCRALGVEASAAQHSLADGHDACNTHDDPCCPTQPEDTPCPCQVECQVRCSYVQTERVQLDDQLALYGPLFGMPIATLQLDGGGTILAAADYSDGPPGCMPVRLHLVFQLLLI